MIYGQRRATKQASFDLRREDVDRHALPLTLRKGVTSRKRSDRARPSQLELRMLPARTGRWRLRKSPGVMLCVPCAEPAPARTLRWQRLLPD